MKNLFSFLAFCLLCSNAFAQLPTQTIAVTFYVDLNSNCSYDLSDQIVNNIATQISYSTASGPIITASQPTFQTCNSQTLICWSASPAPVNTITLLSGGVTFNPCANNTNIPYGTNTMQYLPVVLSGTANSGVQVNLNSISPGQNGFNFQDVASGNTVSICSNFGFDSLIIYANISNLFSCSGSNSMAPRTYSVFCDNVLLDWFSLNGRINSNNIYTGVLNNVSGSEYYSGNSTFLSINPNLPATFTATGTHTLAIKSTLIYNNSTAFLNYLVYFNPVPCARISGRFYNDCNNNCTFDAGDSYGVGYNATGYLYNGNGTNITFNPDAYTGQFNLIVPANSAFSLTQYPTLPSNNYTACTTGTISILAATTVTNLLFGYRSNPQLNTDPAVYVSRLSSTSTLISPQVGATFGVFVKHALLSLCNSTNVNNPGKIKVVLPKFFSFVSNVSGSTPTLNTSGTISDTLTYAVANFTNLPYGMPVVSFSAVVNATAVANTQFSISAYIYPTVDLNILNNTYHWVRTIGGPFDPNGKYCQVANKLSDGSIPFGTQDFIYEIGFQNIGSGPAINVTTLDTIDSNFDLNSLRVLQSSFPVSVQKDLTSRAVYFHFHDIKLAGSQYDEPNSHGFVRYQIKLKPGVPANTILKNRGHNYFDLLEPVATNQTANKLVNVTGINALDGLPFVVKAAPNPVTSLLKIETNEEIETIAIYTISGQLLINLSATQSMTEINMENYAAGLYVLKVSSKSQKTAFIKVLKDTGN